MGVFIESYFQKHNFDLFRNPTAIFNILIMMNNNCFKKEIGE